MNVFFLKQIISALMIVVNLLQQYPPFFVYLHFQRVRLCHVNGLKEGKIMSALHFHFVSFVLDVIVFDYNGLKQSLILQTKPNRLLQFFLWEPYLCLFEKSILRDM